MATKPPKQKDPDPATISSTIGDQAKREQELRRRRSGGYYTFFRNIQRPEQTGGSGNQTVGGGN